MTKLFYSILNILLLSLFFLFDSNDDITRIDDEVLEQNANSDVDVTGIDDDNAGIDDEVVEQNATQNTNGMKHLP